jgi:microcystin-dependent protein
LTLTNPAANPQGWAASVYAVKDAISSISLEDLEDTKELAAAVDGDAVVFNGTLNRWEAKRSAVATLANIGDVNIATLPTAGQVLSWDTASSKWIPKAAASSLATLTDVNVKGVGDTNLLKYDASQSKWIPIAASLAGAFLSDVNLRDRAVNPGDVIGYDGVDGVWRSYSIGLDWLNDVELNSKTQAKDDLLQFDGTKWVNWKPNYLVVPDSTTLAKDDLLQFNGTSWVNWKPNYLNDTTGYTKVQIDAKLTTLLQGVEHGLAVEALTNTPPATPAVDDLYIVGTVPTGAWVGHANELAAWDGKAWQFEAARDKEAHLVEDQQATFHWNGTAWVKIATAIAGGTSAQSGVGEIVPWIGDNIPATDYLECIGQIVAISIYPELHTAIGNKYNPGTAADGTTTFALPDLRGYFLRGDKAGLNVGTKQQWTTGRPRTSFTADSQGDHKHLAGLAHFSSSPAYSQESAGNIGTIPGEVSWNKDSNRAYTSTNGAHTHTVTGGGDGETAPDHFAVKWLIRYKPINGGAKGDKGDKGFGVPATSTAGDVLTYDGATSAWVGTAAAPTYPKLVAKNVISHHMYGTSTWEETTSVITNVQAYVPAGHLYKFEFDARLVVYHGGAGSLHTKFSGSALYGNAGASGELATTEDPPGPGHSRTIVGPSVAGPLTLTVKSRTDTSNGDRQAFGQCLLWDLGPEAAIPSYT